MQNDIEVTQEHILAVAMIMQPDLSPERLATLAWSLRTFLKLAEQLRAIDAGCAEPPVLMFDEEASL